MGTPQPSLGWRREAALVGLAVVAAVGGPLLTTLLTADDPDAGIRDATGLTLLLLGAVVVVGGTAGFVALMRRRTHAGRPQPVPRSERVLLPHGVAFAALRGRPVPAEWAPRIRPWLDQLTSSGPIFLLVGTLQLGVWLEMSAVTGPLSPAFPAQVVVPVILLLAGALVAVVLVRARRRADRYDAHTAAP